MTERQECFTDELARKLGFPKLIFFPIPEKGGFTMEDLKKIKEAKIMPLKTGIVNVYNEYGEVVAQVKYSENLDFWDGSNYTCGSTGRHKGLTRLKTGEYVLIHGTQWQGERDWAEIITPEQALQEILKSGNMELLEEERFSELKALYEKTIIQEEEVSQK